MIAHSKNLGSSLARSQERERTWTPELAKLAYIVDHNIPRFMAASCTIDDYIVSGFAKDLRKEHARIEFLWTKIALNDERQRHAGSSLARSQEREPTWALGYVRSRQQDLIRLTGMLLCYAQPSDLFRVDASGVLALYQHVLKVLRDLLSFLEDHFQQHLEWNLCVPADYRSIEMYAIGCNLEELKVTLAERVLEKTTVKVVGSAFAALEQRLAELVPYCQLAYRRRLKELLKCLSVQKRIPVPRNGVHPSIS